MTPIQRVRAELRALDQLGAFFSLWLDWRKRFFVNIRGML